ncbi:GNAT family N-acetyltransferase [Chachezhania sediminis]|uniref:GNAT family N-acetyltransferase n=1 Tax=Chachezhania sediminis TaxID=2599291 RepID=UPI00131BC9C9|nr:GNAT family N-acetyltransferase [Chachezhania sediminis]
MTSIEIVPFTTDHLTAAQRLSAAAGWPHRIEDWAFTLKVSGGFAAVADGRVVGTALCSPMGDRAGINMIIVEKDLRGQGLGRRLMEAALTLAGDRDLQLTATAEGRPLYEKLGFVAVGQVLQCQGHVQTIPVAPHVALRPATADDLDTICAMDRDATGSDRRGLLAELLANDRVLIGETGFGAVRTFGKGRLIGPVVAADRSTALALIATFAEPGQFLRIDVTDDADLAPVLSGAGLTVLPPEVAMVRGASAPVPERFRRYALVSQALG